MPPPRPRSTPAPTPPALYRAVAVTAEGTYREPSPKSRRRSTPFAQKRLNNRFSLHFDFRPFYIIIPWLIASLLFYFFYPSFSQLLTLRLGPIVFSCFWIQRLRPFVFYCFTPPSLPLASTPSPRFLCPFPCVRPNDPKLSTSFLCDSHKS